jgi:hypothetical protein
MKVAKDDRVIGTAAGTGEKDGLTVTTAGGRKIEVTPRRYRVTGRGGKGVEVIKRGGLERAERGELSLPALGGEDGEGEAEGGKPRRGAQRDSGEEDD